MDQLNGHSSKYIKFWSLIYVWPELQSHLSYTLQLCLYLWSGIKIQLPTHACGFFTKKMLQCLIIPIFVNSIMKYKNS